MTVAYDGKLRLVSNGGMVTRIEPCCRGMDLALMVGCIRSDYDQDVEAEILVLDVFTKRNISKEVRIHRCPWCGAEWRGEIEEDVFEEPVSDATGAEFL